MVSLQYQKTGWLAIFDFCRLSFEKFAVFLSIDQKPSQSLGPLGLAVKK